jgi:hypothetical protein
MLAPRYRYRVAVLSSLLATACPAPPAVVDGGACLDGGAFDPAGAWAFKATLEPVLDAGRTLGVTGTATIGRVTLSRAGADWVLAAPGADGGSCCTPGPRFTVSGTSLALPAQSFNVAWGTPMVLSTMGMPGMSYSALDDWRVTTAAPATATPDRCSTWRFNPVRGETAEYLADGGLMTPPTSYTFTLELTR